MRKCNEIPSFHSWWRGAGCRMWCFPVAVVGLRHRGDVSSLLYATPPPSRSGPKAPQGGRGGGGIGGGGFREGRFGPGVGWG